MLHRHRLAGRAEFGPFRDGAVSPVQAARHVVATLPRIRSTDGNGLINGGYAVAARLIETFAATRGMNLSGEFVDLGGAEVEFPDELNDALAGCGLLPLWISLRVLLGSMILLLSALTIIGTLVSDILLAVVDPRIRLGD